MKATHREVLAPLLRDAVEGVFSAYGNESRAVDGEDHGHDIVAVLGFAADHLRGGLALGISFDLAKRIAPPDCGSPEPDWVGELANQVLGRMRNQLLRYDVDLGVGSPVVLAGVGISVKPSRDVGLHHQCFLSGTERFDAFLEVVFDAGYEFKAPREESVAAGEGSLLMF
jgi:CheY-specific phosphatase CheX